MITEIDMLLQINKANKTGINLSAKYLKLSKSLIGVEVGAEYNKDTITTVIHCVDDSHVFFLLITLNIWLIFTIENAQ